MKLLFTEKHIVRMNLSKFTKHRKQWCLPKTDIRPSLNETTGSRGNWTTMTNVSWWLQCWKWKTVLSEIIVLITTVLFSEIDGDWMKKNWDHMSSSSALFLDIARWVFSLRHKSPAWQGQRSVQDRLCSKQMHPFMHTDFPLQVQTRSCKKSEDICPLK